MIRTFGCRGTEDLFDGRSWVAVRKLDYLFTGVDAWDVRVVDYH